jgi:hypothetical protein
MSPLRIISISFSENDRLSGMVVLFEGSAMVFQSDDLAIFTAIPPVPHTGWMCRHKSPDFLF